MRIRNEEPLDHGAVEALTRRAFYNLYVPGCVEHYLAHIMRGHEDFVPELDFVLEEDGRIIGNIMYTRVRLVDEVGREKEILTFGPVCVEPGSQRRGYGKALMEHSFARAAELGYDAIVIFGSPANYVSRGFLSCKKFCVSTEGRRWAYRGSPVMAISEEGALCYDDTLPPMLRRHQPSQEEFYILSRSFVE